MSIVVIIVVVIVILLFLLVFTFGFFLGLGRKKKDLKLIEKEQDQQKKTQESIIHHFLYEKEDIDINKDFEIFPVKIIGRGYKWLKKFLKFKLIVSEIKELELILYLRKYILSYIGIAVFIFGFGYFVKYAIDSAYINISGRFFIAIFIAAVLVILSHLIRKKYKTFSSILMGGAIGSLYITFTISFYNYNIFSTFQVFSVYFILTFLSIALSLIYRRNELLILAVVAGFSAPFISGVDYENFIVIIVYIILLNLAGVIIAIKNSNIKIRYLFSIFSGVYMVLWVYNSYQINNFKDFDIGFVLLTLLYFLLIIMSVGNSIKYKVQDIQPLEYSLTIVINLIFYSVGIYLLNKLNPDYKGVFTALMAVYNMFFLILTLIIKKGISINLTYLFGIISVLFITLIPPVQFVGKTITMIWAIESVLLFWFSLKLNISVLRGVSIFLMICLTIGFSFDVFETYNSVSHNAPRRELLLNQNFISGLFASVSFALNVLILNKIKDVFLFKSFKISLLKILLTIVGVIFIYFTFYTEILYRITIIERNDTLIQLYIGIYNLSFILIANVIILFIKNKRLKYISGISSLVAVVLFFSYYLYQIIIVRGQMLTEMTVSFEKFLSHIFLIAILLTIIFISYINLRNLNNRIKSIYKWVGLFFVIMILSSEIDHFSTILNFDGTPISSIISNTHYFYYTIFWMLFSLFISFTALVFYDKELIRIAMFIIIISLLKIFILDFSNITLGERTISLIVAGFVLLFVAYVRQKLFEKIDLKQKHIYEDV